MVDEHFQYYNLFDASVDAFHAATEKVNVGQAQSLLLGALNEITNWGLFLKNASILFRII